MGARVLHQTFREPVLLTQAVVEAETTRAEQRAQAVQAAGVRQALRQVLERSTLVVAVVGLATLAELAVLAGPV
jgi:hypothetical protein